MTLSELKRDLLDRPVEERAELMDSLWESLLSEEEIAQQAKWIQEAERRSDAVERGELGLVDGPTALRRLREELGG